ncbi:MAG TPA: AarF/UbiB family protein [Thermoanaerobaculia bacterium]|nr:AarF/UbiB family protein [Thermoanaerobaculia bacterium]
MAEPRIEELPPTLAAELPPELEWEILVERPPQGLLRRFFTTNRHFLALLFGGLAAWARDLPERRRHGLRYLAARFVGLLAWPFLDRRLARLPFPVQLRRRLEAMGSTYIKLGQVLALREDILPAAITRELANLLDRLPVVPYERFVELVSAALGRPALQVFAEIDPRPLGSASIAQIHRGRTAEGDDVVLKLVKPGIRETLRRDAVLLKILGVFLQVPLARFRPRRMIGEFVEYTFKEVDLRREADNAENFAANFADVEDVVFPRIFRPYSGRDLLCMEYLEGLKPSDARVQALPEEDKDRLVDLGAAAIIRMLYRDGFFHADLHPGNLLVLPGARVGFIDLGMVGRFNEELRRTLLYYYYCLVTGDAENAARYLAAVAEPMAGSDMVGFRREVEEVCRRWQRSATFEGFSLAQLILESVGRGAQFRIYFPVELVLMVKALVTFEGVGHVLKPGFDVAAVSQAHINGIFLRQFSPLRLAREGLRGAPELVDALVKAPMLVTEGLRLLEAQTRRPTENPFAGIRGTILGGFFLLAGAILATGGAPWWVAALLFATGVLVAVRPGR